MGGTAGSPASTEPSTPPRPSHSATTRNLPAGGGNDQRVSGNHEHTRLAEGAPGHLPSAQPLPAEPRRQEERPDRAGGRADDRGVGCRCETQTGEKQHMIQKPSEPRGPGSAAVRPVALRELSPKNDPEREGGETQGRVPRKLGLPRSANFPATASPPPDGLRRAERTPVRWAMCGPSPRSVASVRAPLADPVSSAASCAQSATLCFRQVARSRTTLGDHGAW